MTDLVALATNIKTWGHSLGFTDVRITDVDLSHREAGFQAWLDKGYHGEMDYMASHGTKRVRPAELVPGTVRVICVRLPYLPASPQDWRAAEVARHQDPQAGVVSVYARGRDYHKVLRNKLQQLAHQISAVVGDFGYRVFTDSAPVLEVALAEKAGLGWRGKHTLLLSRSGGSMFFLGELFTDLPLPIDAPEQARCGQCTSCIDVCPTQAIVAPYEVDARRCISYLTIELKGAIPEHLRPLIGNRIYGCDDCQLYCPWNKFAQTSAQPDFAVRHGLDNQSLLALLSWDEATFLKKTEGSAIRRIGHARWLRNILVGLGNAAVTHKGDAQIVAALQSYVTHPLALVQEHAAWALAQHVDLDPSQG
jgi:epoxyqueuosine reductase